MSGDGERGATLVESLVAVVLAGVTMAAVLGGLGLAARTGPALRDRADAALVLAAAADAVRDPGRNPYVPCGDDPDYDAAAGIALPDGWDGAVAVTGYRWWDGTGFDDDAGACTPGSSLQLVTVEVTDPGGRTAVAEVVKAPW